MIEGPAYRAPDRRGPALRSRFRLRRLAALLLAALGGAAASAEVALSPLDLDARLSVGLVDNVGQAQRDRDIVEDEFAELELGAGYTASLFRSRLEASARAFLLGREQAEVPGLGHYGGGGELGLEARLTASALPPFARLLLRAEGEEYDFDQRDSTVYSGRLEVGGNLGPRTVVLLGGELRDRRARSDVFDLSRWSAYLDVNFSLGQVWQVGARGAWVDGDVWSSVQTELPGGGTVDDIFDLIAASEAIQRDDAFNDALDGLWFVYRLPAESQEYSLRVSRTLGERMSLAFEWLEVRVQGERNNDYDNRVLQLSLGLRI